MDEYIKREALIKRLWVTPILKYGIPTYTRDGVIDLVEKQPAVDVVEVVRCTDEIRKAMDTLNFYRNRYYAEPSNTEAYAVADAINTILPRFYKCLDTARMDGDA